MPKVKTGSFITELPLKVNSQQDRELEARFQAARQMYNACLSEAMTRVKLIRDSVAYQEAQKISRTTKKQRAEAFKKAADAYRYSEYDLHAYAAIVAKKSGWIADTIDSQVAQNIAKRAFRASQRVMFGRAKKVRVKPHSLFKSVEGKTNKQGKRRKDNQVVWGKFKISPIIDWTNQVIKHGLDSPVKYVRLNRKLVNEILRHGHQLKTENVSVKGWQKRYKLERSKS